MAYSWNKSMGAPSNYDQWVSYQQQNGSFITNDQQRQDAYRKYATSRGLPTPWITPVAPTTPTNVGGPPDFSKMPLDPQGVTDQSNAKQQYQGLTGKDPLTGAQTGVGSLQDTLTGNLAEIAGQRMQGELGWKDADRRVGSNTAGRGMFNSGMRRFGWNRNLTNWRMLSDLLDTRATRANNDFTRGMGAAESGWQMGNQTAQTGSADRQMNNWYATRGLT